MENVQESDFGLLFDAFCCVSDRQEKVDFY